MSAADLEARAPAAPDTGIAVPRLLLRVSSQSAAGCRPDEGGIPAAAADGPVGVPAMTGLSAGPLVRGVSIELVVEDGAGPSRSGM